MILTIITFLLVLSILVFIHELGHFLVARLIGVRVEEFGFGLPPKILGKKFGQTLYSLNALPIGGFVRLAGEDEDPDSIEQLMKKNHGKNVKQFFWARSKKERAAILLAGVTMNFLLAVGITTGLLIYGIDEPAPVVKIDEVMQGSAAERAGIRVGDRIKEIRYIDEAGSAKVAPTRVPQELVTTTRANLGKEITLVVLRDGKEITLRVTPRKDFPQGQGPMGVKIGFDVQHLKYPWYQAPLEAFKLTITRAKNMAISLASLPLRAFQGQKVRDEVAGPIGIAQVTGEAARIGIPAVLNLMSILSLSLALLNTLPVPALDGGRLLFVVIEKVIGKPVNQVLERRAHQIGMILLLTFILLVTLNDLSRFFRA